MDEKIKQRIVGIIVITALLTIFLPMLFESPVDRSSRSISEMQIPEEPEQFQIEQVPESVEQVLQQKKPQAKKKSERKPVLKSAQTNVVKQDRKSKKLVRWVIQVGSFTSKENANNERNKLRKQGFSAFMETHNNIYRVRLAPELDKAKAEKIKQKLEEKNNIKTILVSE